MIHDNSFMQPKNAQESFDSKLSGSAKLPLSSAYEKTENYDQDNNTIGSKERAKTVVSRPQKNSKQGTLNDFTSARRKDTASARTGGVKDFPKVRASENGNTS